ncbi:unnamed protein product [Lactuca saligna]|uniref:Uncharacterized protein n=1 Tax=Lactuca saligna TaxID=75948 RepID=A0AA36E7X2_LACSI|nr:unnamed protein product [Lactuca saligna]
MKKENISSPKAFIAKQDESEKYVEEKETFEDKGINDKGFMALIKDTSNSVSGKCSTDISQAVEESSSGRDYVKHRRSEKNNLSLVYNVASSAVHDFCSSEVIAALLGLDWQRRQQLCSFNSSQPRSQNLQLVELSLADSKHDESLVSLSSHANRKRE